MKLIKILLVEDHPIARQGLRSLLKTKKDIDVIEEADSGQSAVEMAKKFHPDLILMDISMPHLDGLEASRQILRIQPSVRILMLTAHDDLFYFNQAMELGVSGFVSKQFSATLLLQAVKTVVEGGTFFKNPPSEFFQQFRPGMSSGKYKSELTTREVEVLGNVAQGMANKQIAAKLDISIKTVEKHRQSVMNKLNVHETAGLTRLAISEGIVALESSTRARVLCFAP